MPDNYEIVYQGRNMDMTSGGVYTEYLMASDAETTDLPTDGRPGSIAYNPTTGDLYMMDMSKSWNAVGSGGGGGSNPTIPTPTAEDNGKFLGVSNGEYALTEGGGSGGGALYVTFSYDSENDSYSADKTYAEIAAALDAGQAVFGTFADGLPGIPATTHLFNCVEAMLDSDGGNYITFASIALLPGTQGPIPKNARISQKILTIEEDNTVSFVTLEAEFSS